MGIVRIVLKSRRKIEIVLSYKSSEDTSVLNFFYWTIIYAKDTIKIIRIAKEIYKNEYNSKGLPNCKK